MTKLLVEIDGTDGTGKTTLATELTIHFARRNVACVAVPSASSLISRFDRLSVLSASEQVALEIDGYSERLAWAASANAAVVLIDRGMATLIASSRARLTLAGIDEDFDLEAYNERLVRHARSWRFRRTILLGTSNLSIAAWLKVFRTRERELVSPAYRRYQEQFVTVMREHEQCYAGLVVDACLESAVVARQTETWLIESFLQEWTV